MIPKNEGKALGIRTREINVNLGLNRQHQLKKNDHWLHISFFWIELNVKESMY